MAFNLTDVLLSLVGHYNEYSTTITLTCCVIIILGARRLLKAGGERARLVPGISVSAGIFFTFLGLALALVDAANFGVESQFGALLGGLSTAFWTSVVGMGVSIYAKLSLASRADQKESNIISKEVLKVRAEISTLGDDINKHITSALKNAMTNFSKDISHALRESGQEIDDLNKNYIENVRNLDESVASTVKKLNGAIIQSDKILNSAMRLSEETNNLLTSQAPLLQTQASWVEQIEHSMASVANLAPEAKNVFSSIETLNNKSLEFKESLNTTFEDTHEKFCKEIARISNDTVHRIAGVDTENYSRIVEHLQHIDTAIHESFDTVINKFGEGVVLLTQKQLGAISEIISQLENAKETYQRGIELQPIFAEAKPGTILTTEDET